MCLKLELRDLIIRINLVFRTSLSLYSNAIGEEKRHVADGRVGKIYITALRIGKGVKWSIGQPPLSTPNNNI